MIFAAQTRPEDATSSIGAWFRFFGIDRVANSLPASVDTWATTLGALGVLFAAFFLWRGRQRKQKEAVARRLNPSLPIPVLELTDDQMREESKRATQEFRQLADLAYKSRRPRSADAESRAIPSPPDSAPVVPDYPLNAFLGRIYKKLGGRPRDASQFKLEAFHRKVNLEILDAIALHKLHLSGRVGDLARRPISPVEREFATIDHLRQELRSLGSDEDAIVWTDLRFVKAEIDNVWPPPAKDK